MALFGVRVPPTPTFAVTLTEGDGAQGASFLALAGALTRERLSHEGELCFCGSDIDRKAAEQFNQVKLVFKNEPICFKTVLIPFCHLSTKIFV